jgi:hypothetical protein
MEDKALLFGMQAILIAISIYGLTNFLQTQAYSLLLRKDNNFFLYINSTSLSHWWLNTNSIDMYCAFSISWSPLRSTSWKATHFGLLALWPSMFLKSSGAIYSGVKLLPSIFRRSNSLNQELWSHVVTPLQEQIHLALKNSCATLPPLTPLQIFCTRYVLSLPWLLETDKCWSIS